MQTLDIKPEQQTDILFRPLSLRNTTLRNRMIRAATYEGMGTTEGVPKPELGHLYRKLADGGIGAIITGFVYVSQAGRAMHPRQCGIDCDQKIKPWEDVVNQVKRRHTDVPMFMQIAHTGRQTRREVTGLPVQGVSSRPCSFFRQRVQTLDEPAIQDIIRAFAAAARRAQQAGFDGVQIHAAHGYLIHQFLSPRTNTRNDRWAGRHLFLEEVIQAIRAECGDRFPVLVKLSASEDQTPGLQIEDTIETVQRLEALRIDAVEVSYGTMETALNIIRGNCPVDLVLKVNPLFGHIPPMLKKAWKKWVAPKYIRGLIPFSENYNTPAAARIKEHTRLPVFAVGGIRNAPSMVEALTTRGLDAVSLCRALICEPDFPNKIRDGRANHSACTNCNVCTIRSDDDRSLGCILKRKETTS